VRPGHLQRSYGHDAKDLQRSGGGLGRVLPICDWWTRFETSFVRKLTDSGVLQRGATHVIKDNVYMYTLYTCFYILYRQYIYVLGGGFKYSFTPILGKIPILTGMFQRVETTNICIMYDKHKARPPFCKSLATITTFVVGTSYK